jgi:predicted Zn-dependent protease
VKAGKAEEAVGVLTAALALDPRRSSTWTPLAEALALAGRKDESQAALWVAYQWSGNRKNRWPSIRTAQKRKRPSPGHLRALRQRSRLGHRRPPPAPGEPDGRLRRRRETSAGPELAGAG